MSSARQAVFAALALAVPSVAEAPSAVLTVRVTARTSVYTLRVKVPGQPHPWYRRISRPAA